METRRELLRNDPRIGRNTSFFFCHLQAKTEKTDLQEGGEDLEPPACTNHRKSGETFQVFNGGRDKGR